MNTSRAPTRELVLDMQIVDSVSLDRVLLVAFIWIGTSDKEHFQSIKVHSQAVIQLSIPQDPPKSNRKKGSFLSWF